MYRSEAEKYLRSKLSDYCERNGILSKSINGKYKNIRCINPEHKDKNPSMNISSDGERLVCAGCRKFFSVFDLIGMDYGLEDFKSKLEKAADIYGVTLENDPEYTFKQQDCKKVTKEEIYTFIRESAANINDTDYLIKRGILADDINYFNSMNYNIGYSSKDDAIVFPCTGLNGITYVSKYASGNTKGYKFLQGHSVGVFNYECLKTNDNIMVVEGAIDCLSILSVLRQLKQERVESGESLVSASCIGLNSVNVSNTFLELLDRDKSEIMAKKFIIALDNDKAGKEKAEELKIELEKRAYNVDAVNISGRFKDPNESLMADREGLYDAVKTIFTAPSVYDYMATYFQHRKDKERNQTTPTNFKLLDEVLNGGLYGGFYVIGAVSSLGKTTFILQIADQIAKSRRDVMYFSLEMSKDELISKSISRMTLLEVLERKKTISESNRRLAKTQLDVMNEERWLTYTPEEIDILESAQSDYKNIAKHLYMFEGVGDIGVNEIAYNVRKHISITGKTPVVIIDYLQLISAYTDPAHPNRVYSDKQSMDKIVLELKRLTRDCNIPLIAISSLNRESYLQAEISMSAYKESGAIEYTTDVLLSLQYDGIEAKADGNAKDKEQLKAAKKQTPVKVKLNVLKNRRGKRELSVQYNYYAAFNYYLELDRKEQDEDEVRTAVEPLPM